MKTAEIAEKVDLSNGRVLYWRRRYLRDGLGVFGDALADMGDDEDVSEAGESDKVKRMGLGKALRRFKKAGKRGVSLDAPARDLAAAVERAEKRRKKLKKRIKRGKKKEAAKARERLKRIDRRLKRARKLLKKVKT
jgi:seryl-tRNA synthetase